MDSPAATERSSVSCNPDEKELMSSPLSDSRRGMHSIEDIEQKYDMIVSGKDNSFINHHPLVSPSRAMKSKLSSVPEGPVRGMSRTLSSLEGPKAKRGPARGIGRSSTNTDALANMSALASMPSKPRPRARGQPRARSLVTQPTAGLSDFQRSILRGNGDDSALMTQSSRNLMDNSKNSLDFASEHGSRASRPRSAMSRRKTYSPRSISEILAQYDDFVSEEMSPDDIGGGSDGEIDPFGASKRSSISSPDNQPLMILEDDNGDDSDHDDNNDDKAGVKKEIKNLRSPQSSPSKGHQASSPGHTSSPSFLKKHAGGLPRLFRSPIKTKGHVEGFTGRGVVQHLEV